MSPASDIERELRKPLVELAFFLVWTSREPDSQGSWTTRLVSKEPLYNRIFGLPCEQTAPDGTALYGFAELGDLFSLSDNHARRVSAVDEHGVALPQPSIPVAAIIYMFQAMAAGACLMAHGAVPDDEGRWPDDQPPLWAHNIIHRDIKPLNYFLSSSESTLLWPKLPIVALGDFGNATNATDPLFAQSSHELGTKMWMAPEQFPHAPPQHQVSPATNVYQIGLTILHLMHLRDPMVQAKYGIGDPPVFPGFANDDLLYPQDLIDTAQGCIDMDPDERPTPVDLYKAIRDLATSYPDASDNKIPWRRCQHKRETIRSLHTDISFLH
jgi:serine/threonine protein kinase